MGWLAKYYRVGSLCRHWILGLTLIHGHSLAWSQTSDPPDTPDKDYSAELPRIAPLSPEDEYKSFEILDGFEVELVAAEPLVFDPIAFAFDGSGRMFVVEMRDYSEQETERLGSIALLTDANGDGKYDKRSTFVEGLSWPTAIWPWRDGVLVAEPPRITWYRDTNDDGVSDQSELWFEGFHRSNIQGLVNSLRWGVDGYIHGTSSSVGADLTQLMSDQSPLTLRGRDFSIDTLKKSLTAENGGGQHGMSFNRWGDKFVTSNSDHFQQILELDQWLSKHPTSVAMPSLRKSIAEDGPQAEVFRISPVEPWRIVRTRLRMSGVAPGVVEGGGRAAGYFTGATGTWVMDDEMGFGVPGFDTGFACDVGSNLVHRKKLERQGLFYTATRIDAGTELLRAKDIWFRPVQLGDGPDGGLYIADMYREVIEHPKSLPPMIKKHLVLTSGRDKGRIWRLKPEGLAVKMPLPSKWIHQCSNAELVERLTSPIAWQRRAASQMLVERNAIDVKRELVATAIGKKPEAAILAMHILNRLGAFDATLATAGLKQNHPQVLAHSIGLCRTAGLLSSVSSALMKVAGSQDANVQLQLAMAAADLPEAERWKLLSMLTSTKEPLVRN
jgi:putative membrane-bound dehydrogenase-like protein